MSVVLRFPDNVVVVNRSKFQISHQWNLDSWSKYQWQETTKINHKQKQSRYNVETKCIAKPQFNQRINKIKRAKEKITPRNVQLVRFNLTYYGREIDLSNPLSMSSCEEIQMSYKKLASTSSQRTTLISTHFPNLTNEQDTHEFSLFQGVYNCFPTLESNTQKRTNP